ncbi:MAG TPA: HD domain-containing protein [Propionibacteriaceae bacterium]|nr:HD domain-containing protein [Propionibacteriaceae bacterium]
MSDSPVVRRAIKVAAHAHRHVNRKGTDIPYISHPVTVLLILAEAGADEATLAAGVLHDVIEDCGDEYSADRLRREFGDLITDTVLAVTKDAGIKDWRQRNEAYLKNLSASGNQRAWLVSAADKAANLTDILEDYAAHGDKLWSRFNAGKEGQLWWYGAVAQEVAKLIPDRPLAQRLATLVAELNDAVRGGEAPNLTCRGMNVQT